MSEQQNTTMNRRPMMGGRGMMGGGGHGGGHSTDLQKAAARDLFGKHNQISSFFALHDLNLDRVHLGVFAWPDCSVASF